MGSNNFYKAFKSLPIISHGEQTYRDRNAILFRSFSVIG